MLGSDSQKALGLLIFSQVMVHGPRGAACCYGVHGLAQENRIMDRREHQFIGHADGRYGEGNYAGRRASA